MTAKLRRNRKDGEGGSSSAYDFHKINGRKIPGLLNKNVISVCFQPIYSAKNGSLYGYKASAGIAEENSCFVARKLFQNTKRIDALSSLYYLCLVNVVRRAADLGLTQKDLFLFVNISPDTLTSPVYWIDEIGGLIERWGMVKGKIVLEITAGSIIRNYDIFKQAISYYKNSGYLIAIDDLNDGYKGVKMLSFIEPDIIKIDRQYLGKMGANISFVGRIVRVCQRIGITVIATGIEKEDEMEDVLTMDIELIQGKYHGMVMPLSNMK